MFFLQLPALNGCDPASLGRCKGGSKAGIVLQEVSSDAQHWPATKVKYRQEIEKLLLLLQIDRGTRRDTL